MKRLLIILVTAVIGLSAYTAAAENENKVIDKLYITSNYTLRTDAWTFTEMYSAGQNEFFIGLYINVNWAFFRFYSADNFSAPYIFHAVGDSKATVTGNGGVFDLGENNLNGDANSFYFNTPGYYRLHVNLNTMKMTVSRSFSDPTDPIRPDNISNVLTTEFCTAVDDGVNITSGEANVFKYFGPLKEGVLNLRENSWINLIVPNVDNTEIGVTNLEKSPFDMVLWSWDAGAYYNHKWKVTKNGWYTIIWDFNTQTVSSVYHGDQKPAGIDGIDAEQNVPVEYFNLHGIRVDNPSNGVYIRRQGNTVTKVIVQ